MTKTLMALLAAMGALALLGVGPAEPAASARTSEPSGPGIPTGVLMIGDSTTKRVTPWLAEHRPGWHVDGQGGRPVRALGHRIEVYLRSHPAPADFIMALGTNRSFHPAWTRQRLVHAINKLPAETNVYLVMVVRAGRFQAWKDAVLRDYNRISRSLAKTRPNTWIIDWRRTVLRDPTLDPRTGRSLLLEDGTHQTGEPYGQSGPGVETYVRLIEQKLARHATETPSPDVAEDRGVRVSRTGD
ncbi:MAG TPA: hypothetical protein VFO49_02790 [Nocardioides sp.]|nr:hypothetical protein [Nocardioides sp.]